MYERNNDELNFDPLTQVYGRSNTINYARDIWTMLIGFADYIPTNPIFKEIIDLILVTREQIKLFYNQLKDHDWKTQFCTELHPKPCIEPVFPELHPDYVIERYIKRYSDDLRIIHIDTYYQKYLKYKKKYLSLKKY